MTNENLTLLRRHRIRLLAAALSVLSVLVVCISAYVRLDAAGFGCSEWPLCYGQTLAEKINLHMGVARILHRSGASLALVLAFMLAWQALKPQPLQPEARKATALLVLMLFLAAVGLWSSDPHRAITTFINILGGLALVSFSWRVFNADDKHMDAAPRNRWLPFAQAALGVTILLGALIGARFAAASCPTLPFCGDVAWPSATWSAFNPFVLIGASLPVGDEGGVALHLLHRYAALSTLLLLGLAAHAALPQARTRPAAITVLVLLVVEIVLGVLTVASGFSLWLGIGHAVTAALLLAATAGLRRA